jgi:hypothetical protein
VPIGYEPGTVLGGITAVLDDSQGSGTVITFGAADAARCGWRFWNLAGWDSPDLAENAQKRTGADGMWDAANYYGGRTITFDGLIDAPDPVTLQAAKDQLAQALPARDRLVIFAVNDPVPTRVLCRRSGRLMVADQTDTVTQFSVSLLALDPRRYSTSEQTAMASIGAAPGGLAFPMSFPLAFPMADISTQFFDVVNEGDYEAPVLARIAGPGHYPGLANLSTGQTLTYPIDLATGDALVVDTGVGAAMLNGTTYVSPIPGSAVTARFLLPPGTSHMQFLGSRTVPDVTPLLTMTWRSAWI